jgi:hypothetical protein
MWAQLESLSEREAYLVSPFALSGRGDAPAKAVHWKELPSEREPITGRHSLPRIIAAAEDRVETPAADGVRRIERPRVVPLRAPKLARAGS